jgi:hypothetical protein
MGMLLVTIPGGALTLEAGSVSQGADRITILPPAIPMIDQLLTDANAPPHPDLADRQERQSHLHSFISDAEMRRLNIEASANLSRLVRLYRERGCFAFYALLAKAHTYLPMPQQSVPKDAEATALIYGALRAGAGILDRAQEGTSDEGTRAQPRLIAERDADRFLCNVLASHAWRNTTIEDVHAGARAPHALLPQQRRFTPVTERRLLREVSAKLGSVLWAFHASGYPPGRRPRARSPARSTADGPRAGPWRTSRRPSHLNSDACCIAQLYLGP